MDTTSCNNDKIAKVNKRKRVSQGVTGVTPDPATQKSFGFRLKMTREKCGFSQKKLGDLVDTSAISIQSYEGSTMPKVDMLVKLAIALNCSIDWLVYGIPDSKADILERDADDMIKMMLQTINSRLQAIETRLRCKDLEEENARLKARIGQGDINTGEYSAGGM